MQYYTTYNPITGSSFLLCFELRDSEDPTSSPQNENDILAIVELRGKDIIWHKRGFEEGYHFNEFLMSKDMLRYWRYSVESGNEGWEFEAPFPCVLNGSLVTYGWQTA